MSDPITAKARAVEETAKATGKALDIVHDTGGYLAKVVSNVPGDLVGVLGGAWLHEVHIRLRDRLRRRTEQILRDRDVQEFIELSPNLAEALIAGAQEEGREELAELWARLLANAVDPKLNSVRQSFIDAVKTMDPPDALVLLYLYENDIVSTQVGQGSADNKTIFTENLGRELGVTGDFVIVSLENLNSLGFFTGTRPYYTSPKLREFMKACYPELKSA
jgi:hypothetical protein